MKLLDRVSAAIRVRHYSLATERIYIHWIKKYIYFHNRQHPEKLGPEEVSAFPSEHERKTKGYPKYCKDDLDSAIYRSKTEQEFLDRYSDMVSFFERKYERNPEWSINEKLREKVKRDKADQLKKEKLVSERLK
ncbi:MAG TPA: hypothetical protein EYG31_12730 [Porticoccaceae bacterium]|jgi:hypothetical protein|nr:hypothetical protein [Gammaproteobacteria bacterium]HIL61489.1 hypothetical protein [Porticoccaceae bacterium]